jgi:small subunit ribosomal protein S17
MSEPQADKTATPAAKPRGHRRTAVGRVTSTAAAKTLKVQVDRIVKHPQYGKYLRRRTVLHVHDEKQVAQLGDTVEVMECRPISKTKSWRLVRVVRRPGGQVPAAGGQEREP